MTTTTLSPELVAAYRWHKQHDWNGAYRPEAQHRAFVCLSSARADVAAGKARYPAPVKPYAAVSWKADNARGERIAYVQSVDGAGLREVGRVNVESYGGRDCWNKRADESGWYTDPLGDVFKDGTGLCWGVVYQLPGKAGKARFVAGYQFGGTDSGPTLDMGTIFESGESGDAWNRDATDVNAAREAARAADELARIAAEHEREYQGAWQAGSAWQARGEEIISQRRELLALLADRRRVRMDSAWHNSPACKVVLAAIESGLERIRELREERESLASGNGLGKRGDYELSFYISAELKAAFNDGAGKAVLS